MKHTTKTYFNPTNRHEKFNQYDCWNKTQFKEDDPPAWAMIAIMFFFIFGFIAVCFLPLVF